MLLSSVSCYSGHTTLKREVLRSDKGVVMHASRPTGVNAPIKVAKLLRLLVYVMQAEEEIGNFPTLAICPALIRPLSTDST